MSYKLKKDTLYKVKRNLIENKDGNAPKSLFVVGSGDVSVYFSPESEAPTSTAAMQLDTQTYTQLKSPFNIISDFEWFYWTSDDEPDLYIMGMSFEATTWAV